MTSNPSLFHRPARARTRRLRNSLAVLLLAGPAMTGCGGAQLVASEAGSPAPQAPTTSRPADLLSCTSDEVVATTMTDYAPGTRETRSPEVQAAAWAAAQGGSVTGSPTVAHQSDHFTYITFTDSTNRVATVLTFDKGDEGGWLLTTTRACQ
ncbi:hypothetical protein B0I29_10213 [Actinoplanes lutulentus]|uniref:Lipoprotein n=1 Tax=Actinoplanes lutulentus TaxID=1287878 RepID=A0A327ZH45_9ACTN|nr:hypothetical protein [Actinoplanes lutulentus]RAK42192.1 hypothetical protein B0I29_10213 [Actinoplanes lutulentus]